MGFKDSEQSAESAEQLTSPVPHDEYSSDLDTYRIKTLRSGKVVKVPICAKDVTPLKERTMEDLLGIDESLVSSHTRKFRNGWSQRKTRSLTALSSNLSHSKSQSSDSIELVAHAIEDVNSQDLSDASRDKLGQENERFNPGNSVVDGSSMKNVQHTTLIGEDDMDIEGMTLRQIQRMLKSKRKSSSANSQSKSDDFTTVDSNCHIDINSDQRDNFRSSRSAKKRKCEFEEGNMTTGEQIQYPKEEGLPDPKQGQTLGNHKQKVHKMVSSQNSQRSVQSRNEIFSFEGGNIVGPGDAVVNVYINHKKFAFVEMRTMEEAGNAIALDGIMFEGVSGRVRRPSDYNPSLAAALGPSQPSPHLNLVVVGLTPGYGSVVGGAEGPDRIIVGGLSYYSPEAHIREPLESFGPLRGFDLVKDRDTGNSKCYGFCVHQDPAVTDIAYAAMIPGTVVPGQNTGMAQTMPKMFPNMFPFGNDISAFHEEHHNFINRENDPPSNQDSMEIEMNGQDPDIRDDYKSKEEPEDFKIMFDSKKANVPIAESTENYESYVSVSKQVFFKMQSSSTNPNGNAEPHPGEGESPNVHVSEPQVSVPLNDSGLNCQAGGVLPPMSGENPNKKTLVLDLDGTLVHADFTAALGGYDSTLYLEGFDEPLYVWKRPGMDQMLQELGSTGLYEIVIFTVGVEFYANVVVDKILDLLPPSQHAITNTNIIPRTHRLDRRHCSDVEGVPDVVKDLSILGRDLKNVKDVEGRQYGNYPAKLVAPSLQRNEVLQQALEETRQTTTMNRECLVDMKSHAGIVKSLCPLFRQKATNCATIPTATRSLRPNKIILKPENYPSNLVSELLFMLQWFPDQ